MRIDPWALARMTWMSVLFGVGMCLLLEVLRFAWNVFDLRGALLPGAREGDRGSLGGVVALFFRDILFFLVAAVAFSVFVYCTNNGRVRFVAVGGAVLGFTLGYLTLGRPVRKAFEVLVAITHGALGMIVRPAVVIIKLIHKRVHKKISVRKDGERSDRRAGNRKKRSGNADKENK